MSHTDNLADTLIQLLNAVKTLQLNGYNNKNTHKNTLLNASCPVWQPIHIYVNKHNYTHNKSVSNLVLKKLQHNGFL